ncbi:hypothetical protein NQ317_008577 [Molorchus minor]|uniref:Lipase domain-containing protein n=1 Tax=Molorchus minor TaxID=1323400 RepID=A0ABQ9J3E6_9CUCU|nr:hypothetical protein NQ317_008577 [Molorchus minor]
MVCKDASHSFPRISFFTLDIGPNMTYILVEDEDGQYVVEDLVNAPANRSVSPSDLSYYFYSQTNQVVAVKVTNSNLEPLSKTKQAVNTVGMYVAQFVKSLTERFNLTLDKTAMAGHSLGAHVAGNAGAALGSQLDHIVGLDPALPLFSLADTNSRLDPTDAKYVHVIHTCGGMLGFMAPIGHADYYPNGGSSQPGCLLDVTGVCAHARSFFTLQSPSHPLLKLLSPSNAARIRIMRKESVRVIRGPLWETILLIKVQMDDIIWIPTNSHHTLRVKYRY